MAKQGMLKQVMVFVVMAGMALAGPAAADESNPPLKMKGGAAHNNA